jgi:hypothetical protein
MSQELSLSNPMSIQKLFNERQRAVGEMAREIAEREFEIFELNLFASSMGKERLNKISAEVQELRSRADKGEINLSEYEGLAESF